MSNKENLDNSITKKNNDYNVSLGNYIKESRVKKGLSLEEVSSTIKISQKTLNSFENGIFNIPGIYSTYIKGYLNRYVLFLDLDKNITNDVILDDVLTVNNSILPLPNEYANSHQPTRNKKTLLRFLFLVVILLILAVIFYSFKQINKPKINNTIIEQTNEIIKPSEENINEEIKTVPEESKPIEDSKIEQTEVVSKKLQNNIDVNKENTNIQEGLIIRINGGDSWISVRELSSNKVIVENIYKNGDTLNLPSGNYKVIVGNAIHTHITYNSIKPDAKININGIIKFTTTK